MHTFLKVSVPVILFGIIVIAVVVPVVLHFQKDNKQDSPTNKSILLLLFLINEY